MLSTELAVILERLLTMPIIKITTAKKQTRCMRLAVDFSLNLLFMPVNKLPITPMAIITDKSGKYFIIKSIKIESKLAKNDE